MPRPLHLEFEVVVIDDDRGLFSIAGPMRNDTALEVRLNRCLSRGRRVRAYCLVDPMQDRVEVIETIRMQTGFCLVKDVIPNRLAR